MNNGYASRLVLYIATIMILLILYTLIVILFYLFYVIGLGKTKDWLGLCVAVTGNWYRIYEYTYLLFSYATSTPITDVRLWSHYCHKYPVVSV